MLAFVVLDTGSIETTGEFSRNEAISHRERFGRMTPELFVHQSQLSSSAILRVSLLVDISLPEPELPIEDATVPIEEYKRWFAAHASAQVDRIQAAKAHVVKRMEDLGAEIVLNPGSFPIIEMRISVGLLRTPELHGAEVVKIDLVDTRPPSLLGYAGFRSMQSTTATLSGGNCSGPCDGGGIDVGLWEWDGGVPYSGIARANSRISHGNITGYLNAPGTCNTSGDCAQVEGLGVDCKATVTSGPKYCVQDHLTWIAGCVGMFGSYDYTTSNPTSDYIANVPSGTWFGSSGAWQVDFKVGNDNSIAGLDYLINPNASNPPSIPTPYVNRSVTGQNAGVYDWAGRTFGTFLTLAAGNFEAAAVACQSFRNGLCVGMYSYEDYLTMSTHHRAASIANMPGFGILGSSYTNPIGVALERPHVLGPGYHKQTGSNLLTQKSGLHLPSFTVAPNGNAMVNGFYNGSTFNALAGSSFAAPTVLSVAIRAHQYEGWFSPLAFPMVNKAVLLASTRDGNNDGPIGKSNQWSSQPSDAEDGMGQIDLTLVKQVLDNNYYASRDLVNADFVSCGTNCREYSLGNILTLANVSTRVTLAWQSCITTQQGASTIVNDLDLVLSCGNPLQLCGGSFMSNTVDSELEAVSRVCTIDKSCAVRVRIKNGAQLANCGQSAFERVGIAWSYGS